MHLSNEEKRYLLQLARESILNKLSKNSQTTKADNFNILNENCGAFVTLHKEGNLRGCVGYIFGLGKLTDTISQAAIHSAFNDNRFMPVKIEELSDITIEISLLSVPFSMNDYEEIIIGKHGLIVRENNHSGLLLPQVPIEHNMNKEEYLTALCQKAGLPRNLWQKKLLQIDMFTAEVFSENEVINE